jgi:multiple sugar transport system permease protein
VLSAGVSPVGSGLGAPLNSTLFYSVYLFQQSFIYLKMGYASAQAWILFLIIMLCTLLMLRSSERWTYYEGG